MLKEKDFIEIEYVAKIKDSNVIVDLTDEELAKKNNIYNPNFSYGPLIICLGQSHVIPGLDKQLIGKDLGKYTIEVKQEEAFGKKDPKLMKVYQTKKFTENKVNPFPGLQVQMDEYTGIIRTVTPGRTTVDFNHPLAGKDLVYEVKINRIITDIKEKISSLIKLLGIKNPNVEIKDNKAEIKLNIKLPKEIEDKLISNIKELANISDVIFIIQNN